MFRLVSEVWIDPLTNVDVLRKSSNPSSDSTTTIQNYSNAEPDPALFQIPDGYQILDETGSFTITISRPTN
jgi:hypothetical protein